MTTDDESLVSPFTVRTTADSHFAWIRTRLAVENTMLAWVRTGASLISFGFTIYQFFQRLPAPKGKLLLPGGPRDLGLGLIFAGLIALGVSTLQYRSLNKYLRQNGYEILVGPQARHYQSTAPLMAILLLLIGLFAFFTVLFRLS